MNKGVNRLGLGQSQSAWVPAHHGAHRVQDEQGYCCVHQEIQGNGKVDNLGWQVHRKPELRSDRGTNMCVVQVGSQKLSRPFPHRVALIIDGHSTTVGASAQATAACAACTARRQPSSRDGMTQSAGSRQGAAGAAVVPPSADPAVAAC